MPIDDTNARLEMNASSYRPDPELERIADLFTADREAWNRLPNAITSAASVQADMRDHYRRAVAAGAITDDRGPSAA